MARKRVLACACQKCAHLLSILVWYILVLLKVAIVIYLDESLLSETIYTFGLYN